LHDRVARAHGGPGHGLGGPGDAAGGGGELVGALGGARGVDVDLEPEVVDTCHGQSSPLCPAAKHSTLSAWPPPETAGGPACRWPHTSGRQGEPPSSPRACARPACSPASLPAPGAGRRSTPCPRFRSRCANPWTVRTRRAYRTSGTVTACRRRNPTPRRCRACCGSPGVAPRQESRRRPRPTWGWCVRTPPTRPGRGWGAGGCRQRWRSPGGNAGYSASSDRAQRNEGSAITRCMASRAVCASRKVSVSRSHSVAGRASCRRAASFRLRPVRVLPW